MFIRCLTFWFVLTSHAAMALSSLSIFYPPPFQQDGVFYSAKKLFPAENGGLWSLDKAGDLRFYDGQHMLPRRGSAVARKVRDAVYIDQQFWFIDENSLFHVTPPGKVIKTRSIPTQSKLQEIGHSDHLIWISEPSSFHVYDIKADTLVTYPLDTMAAQVSKELQINDAVKLPTRWVVATTAGTFSLTNGMFELVQASKHKHVEVVHYSSRRGELVVGTRNGALLVDLDSVERKPVYIGGAQVHAIAESENAYWIGTRKGLYAYDFYTHTTNEVRSSQHDEFSLPSEHIYSVVSDGQSGIWIATGKGISYYSTLNRLFDRITSSATDEQSYLGEVNQIIATTENDYWLATAHGLFYYQPRKGQLPTRVLKGSVRSLVRYKNGLYLGREQGVTYYDFANGEESNLTLPVTFSGNTVVEMKSDQFGVIWMNTELGLLRFWPGENKIEQLGFSWMLKEHQTGMVTNLYPTRSGHLYIGTDHGLYVYKGGQIHYLIQSNALGRSIDVAESKEGYLWFVNSRGAFVLKPEGSSFLPVALNEPNLMARCVESTEKGIWLSSSKGLSFYQYDGVQRKNFSAPFGLVNNEFLPNICTSSIDGSELVLGSSRGIVRVTQDKLLATEVPASRVLFSKVLVDDRIYKIGDTSLDTITIPHKSSIRFKLGILPDFDQKHLQWRLSSQGDEPWYTLEGTELSLSHLAPGNYTLNVRTEAQAVKALPGSEVVLSVRYPWYLRWWVILMLLIFILLLGFAFLGWREHRVKALNARLQLLVANKTRQLVQQHQVLENSNQQIQRERKVLTAYIAKTVRMAQEKIQAMTKEDFSVDSQTELARLSEQLHSLQLLGERFNKGATNYRLCLYTFVNAVVEAWLKDAQERGISIALECRTADTWLSIEQFNLEKVFNQLVAYQLQIAASGQLIRVIIESRGGYLMVSSTTLLASPGNGTDAVQSGEITHLNQLLLSNRGYVEVSQQDTTLMVSLCWPGQESDTTVIPAGLTTAGLGSVSDVSDDNPWLDKVYRIIESEFSNPEFSTSSAAKQLYMSERSLQRKFKQQAGRTFSDYLNQVRMDKACRLLVTGSKISEVAYLSGYNDPSYFSRKFKLFYGLSPSRFLEKVS